MATIKAIEGQSIHQIQSGQVIVDLVSVVKELVENGLDAGATSIDVRFKNNGLDAIEVQDNGSGIAAEDYETIALKHYTSKLSSYDDLTTLNTFGFRGEALSSLCALAKFHIATAREGEAPRGKRLDFETSGKLKNVSVAACQKGTTVVVEELFYNLIVRRKELDKNLKREYSKVLGILQAYACISSGVRLSVSNQMPKGKKVHVFSTHLNSNTKENIANVFGAKALLGLITLELNLELRPTTYSSTNDGGSGDAIASRRVQIQGHISRPAFGEGRQAPDRQMFFVNSRPCGLPQIAKAFNEVYKSYNSHQSPFVFANMLMDTNAYDVNVSPDKRTILLHDQPALLESLKKALTELFESQEQTIPEVQPLSKTLPPFRPLTVSREISSASEPREERELNAHSHVGNAQLTSDMKAHLATDVSSSNVDETRCNISNSLLSNFIQRNHAQRPVNSNNPSTINVLEKRNALLQTDVSEAKRRLLNNIKAHNQTPEPRRGNRNGSTSGESESEEETTKIAQSRVMRDFNDRFASQQAKATRKESTTGELIPIIPVTAEDEISSTISSPVKSPAGVVQSAFDRMRPARGHHETATITVGAKTSTATIGYPTPVTKRRKTQADTSPEVSQSAYSRFSQSLRAFAAPGNHGDIGGNDNNMESEALNMADNASSSGAEESMNGCISEENIDAEDNAESDSDYFYEEEERKVEEDRVAELVHQAETEATISTQASQKRAAVFLSSPQKNASTLNLLKFLETSVSRIDEQLAILKQLLVGYNPQQEVEEDDDTPATNAVTAEERLSLTITRSDFEHMRVVGQFNLGFILATRSATSQSLPEARLSHRRKKLSDDLFIIDQHASDEIYNFEGLSKSTVLTPQTLVRPHPLELTAIEEETILNYTDIFAKNGFNITVDTTGASPVGNRCKLLTLPTSRETTFNTGDLEELIALLNESPPVAGEVARPSRVRRMLAMRACRSSIMVGKTLTKKSMETVVRHMGEMDRPWNCPHGRPTMRHLAGLGDWSAWEEGDGMTIEEDGLGQRGHRTDWATYVGMCNDE